MMIFSHIIEELIRYSHFTHVRPKPSRGRHGTHQVSRDELGGVTLVQGVLKGERKRRAERAGAELRPPKRGLLPLALLLVLVSDADVVHQLLVVIVVDCRVFSGNKNASNGRRAAETLGLSPRSQGLHPEVLLRGAEGQVVERIYVDVGGRVVGVPAGDHGEGVVLGELRADVVFEERAVQHLRRGLGLLVVLVDLICFRVRTGRMDGAMGGAEGRFV